MPTKNEPNQPVSLAETRITDIDGEPADFPVNVNFQLFPYPRVVAELEQLPGVVLQKERFRVRMGNGAEWDATLLTHDNADVGLVGLDGVDGGLVPFLALDGDAPVVQAIADLLGALPVQGALEHVVATN